MSNWLNYVYSAVIVSLVFTIIRAVFVLHMRENIFIRTSVKGKVLEVLLYPFPVMQKECGCWAFGYSELLEVNAEEREEGILEGSIVTLHTTRTIGVYADTDPLTVVDYLDVTEHEKAVEARKGQCAVLRCRHCGDEWEGNPWYPDDTSLVNYEDDVSIRRKSA